MQEENRIYNLAKIIEQSSDNYKFLVSHSSLSAYLLPLGWIFMRKADWCSGSTYQMFPVNVQITLAHISISLLFTHLHCRQESVKRVWIIQFALSFINVICLYINGAE